MVSGVLGVVIFLGISAVSVYVIYRLVSAVLAAGLAVLLIVGIIVFFSVDLGGLSGKLPTVVQDWISLARGIF